MIQEHSAIETMPSRVRCEEIIVNNIEERIHTDHRRWLHVELPFVITKRLITIDHKQVNQMGLTPEKYEVNERLDDVVKTYDWNVNFEHKDEYIEDIWEVYRDQSIENMASTLYDVLSKGFVKRTVYGYRYEPIEKDRKPRITSREKVDIGEDFETRKRRYDIGTERLSIKGVVTDDIDQYVS